MHLKRTSTSAGLLVLIAWAATAAAAQTVPPGRGRVVSLTGNLSLKRVNQGTQAVALNQTVATGDELVTDARSEAVIQLHDGSTVHMYPDSRIILNEEAPGVTGFLYLFFGSIKLHIEKLSGRPNPHSMTTPTAVIAVRGTTFSVFVDDTDATLVAVDEGLVTVANRRAPSNEVLLRPGQRTWVRGAQPPLRAQAFRGHSQDADMMPGAHSMNGMAGSAMTGGAMGGAMHSSPGGGMSGHGAGMAGMSGRRQPPH